MFIEIIAEAIRGKSFIAEKEEEDNDEDGESRILGKSNYRAARKQAATEISE